MAGGATSGTCQGKLLAVDAVQQQVALDVPERVHGRLRVEDEAVVLRGGVQGRHVALGEQRVPAEHGAPGDGALVVDQAVHVGPQHGAEAGAGGARAGGLVEREVRHAHRGHRRPAVGARRGLLTLGRLVRFPAGRLVVPGLVAGHVIFGRDVPSARRTRAVADPRPEHAQVREDLGGRPDRRPRAAVGEVALVHADRRRQARDRVDLGPGGVGDHAQRLEVLPLAFPVQGVEGERGLAGTGEAAEGDELVLRDGDGEVLEVVQARAPDEDCVVHGRR